MIALNPLAVSVTWGAGGTTKDRTLDLAGLTQVEYGADTILHLTCTNMVQGTADEALRVSRLVITMSSLAEGACRKRRSGELRTYWPFAEVRRCRIHGRAPLIITIDPPRGAEHWIPTDSRFQHGVDLVRYIKSTPEFADFCVGVAGHFLTTLAVNTHAYHLMV